MNKETDIPISIDDLKFILKGDFDQSIRIVAHNCFCPNCYDSKKVGMVNYRISLTKFNDAFFRGECEHCGHQIARYVEIGENPDYELRIEIIKEQKAKNN